MKVINPFKFSADDFMNANDTSGQSSFVNSTHWLSGSAPASGKNYRNCTADGLTSYTLRTPHANTGSFTFAGNRLTLKGLQFNFKNSGVTTIDDLRLNGATLFHAQTSITMPNYARLAGNCFLVEGTTNIFDIAGATSGIPGGTQKIYTIGCTIRGPGNLQFGNVTDNADTTAYYEITGTANVWTGTMLIKIARVKATTGSIPALCAVTLDNYAGTAKAILELVAALEIGSLAGGGASSGNVVNGGYLLTLGGNNANTTFDGVISGTGGLTKKGTGTWSVTRAQTYSGATTIQAGTLNNTGASFASTATTIKSGGTLAGLGTMEGVTLDSGGTLAPGLGATTTGNVTFVSGSTFGVQLYRNGIGENSNSKIYTAAGTVALASATLSVAFEAGTTHANTSWDIVSAATLTGTFNGLADNATFVVSGRTLRVNYTGTTCTLTDVT